MKKRYTEEQIIKERVRTAKTLHPQIAPNHPAYAHQ